MDPVPAMTAIPCPAEVAPASAMTASVVTIRRRVRRIGARMAGLSSGPPLMPKHAASKQMADASRPAFPHAASKLSLTPRSRRARPPPAAALWQAHATPEPRMRRVSSPMTALVLDWPPSTPKKSRMAPFAPTERRGGQSILVIEVAFGVVGPGIANVQRIRNRGIRHYHRKAIDNGVGGNEPVVGAGHHETLQGPAPGFEAAGGVVEPQADGARFCGARAHQWTRVFDLLAKGHRPGGQRQALAHVLLVGGMDVVRVADIDSNGHSGLGDAQRLELRLAEFGPHGGGRSLIIGDLHEQEREVAHSPSAPPVDDHGFEHGRIQGRADSRGVALSLIPDDSADGV